MKKILTLITLLTVISTQNLLACSTPVFRYALERWPADIFNLEIISKGELSKEEKALVEWTEEKYGYYAYINHIDISKYVDKIDDKNKDAKILPKDIKRENITSTIVRLKYPETARIKDIIWEGALTKLNMERVFESPLRRSIAKEILAGNSKVWLFFESGNKEQDEKYYNLLDKKLKELEKEIGLPEEEEGVPVTSEEDEAKLKIAFKIIKVSKQNKNEEILKQMIKGLEPKIMTTKEPYTIPFFGRGRGLAVLIGEEIKDDYIEEISYFITGSCSCEIKAQNPGLDVLIAIEWDEFIDTMINLDETLPPLTSFADFVEKKPEIKEVKEEEKTEIKANVQNIKENNNDLLIRNIIVIISAIILLIIISSLIIINKKKNE